MPIELNVQAGAETPKGPHLALLTAESEAIPIVLGSKMFIVLDPERTDRVVPVFLAKLNRNSLDFRCNCGQGNCTRVFHYKLEVKGHHPETRK